LGMICNLLHIKRNPPVFSEAIQALDRIHDREFAKQRNRLHYSHVWLFDDLHSFMSPLDFCRFADETGLIGRLDVGSKDFGITLAFTLFWISRAMLKSMTETTSALADELRLLDESLEVARHPLFEHYSSCMSEVEANSIVR
jgi:hypothetical protein